MQERLLLCMQKKQCALKPEAPSNALQALTVHSHQPAGDHAPEGFGPLGTLLPPGFRIGDRIPALIREAATAKHKGPPSTRGQTWQVLPRDSCASFPFLQWDPPGSLCFTCHPSLDLTLIWTWDLHLENTRPWKRPNSEARSLRLSRETALAPQDWREGAGSVSWQVPRDTWAVCILHTGEGTGSGQNPAPLLLTTPGTHSSTCPEGASFNNLHEWTQKWSRPGLAHIRSR